MASMEMLLSVDPPERLISSNPQASSHTPSPPMMQFVLWFIFSAKEEGEEETE